MPILKKLLLLINEFVLLYLALAITLLTCYSPANFAKKFTDSSQINKATPIHDYE